MRLINRSVEKCKSRQLPPSVLSVWWNDSFQGRNASETRNSTFSFWHSLQHMLLDCGGSQSLDSSCVCMTVQYILHYALNFISSRRWKINFYVLCKSVYLSLMFWPVWFMFFHYQSKQNKYIINIQQWLFKKQISHKHVFPQKQKKEGFYLFNHKNIHNLCMIIRLGQFFLLNGLAGFPQVLVTAKQELPLCWRCLL